MFLYLTTIN